MQKTLVADLTGGHKKRLEKQTTIARNKHTPKNIDKLLASNGAFRINEFVDGAEDQYRKS